MEEICALEMSVLNHLSPRNNTEDRRIYFKCDGSFRSRYRVVYKHVTKTLGNKAVFVLKAEQVRFHREDGRSMSLRCYLSVKSRGVASYDTVTMISILSPSVLVSTRYKLEGPRIKYRLWERTSLYTVGTGSLSRE
jgi:hypothetical protein